MVRNDGNVGSDHRQRISVAVTGLNLSAAKSIRIIAAPNLLEITEDSQICSIAAGRAALKQNLRERFCQRPHQAVQTEHITVRHFPLLLRRQQR